MMPQEDPRRNPGAERARQGVESLFSQGERGWLVGLLLISAAAIRIRGALNDLWLDEIWSLTTVRSISSPLDVFTKIHLDNNHYLSSLWLYLFRDHANWPGYRVPSIVAGIGCVLVAGMIGRRQNARAALIAMFLVAFSYVQILYSSEVRGYSEVMFFSFVSFYALDRYMEEASWKFAFIFSVSSILGFAADVIFLNFYCAAVLWSGWRFSKSGLGKTGIARSMLACHAAPTAFILALYLVDLRRMIVGGGTPSSLTVVYAKSLAWTFGVGSGGFGILAAILTAALFFMAGVWLVGRQQSDSLIFFVGVILVVPIVLVIVHHSDVLYVRYFIIGMGFLLIVFSYVLAAIYRRAWQGRVVCVLLLAAYFLVNGWHTLTLFKYGRGQYSDAVRFMIQNTKGPDVTFGSDHDFRVSLVLQFYIEQETGDKTIKYFLLNAWPRTGPEWVVHHRESFKDPSHPQSRFADGAGNIYEFVKTYPTAPLSGLHWFIYHNTSTNFARF